MTVLPIVRWPDPRLSEICVPIAEITPEVEALAADMLATMYEAQGRGLAGPQVGAMLRIFVMDIGWKEGKSDPLICINPMFQEIGEDFSVGPEGCLSIPDVTADVSRPTTVQMVWTGVNGARYVQGFDGFAAICAQHELDHLDGVVTFDHLTASVRSELETAYQEAQA